MKRWLVLVLLVAACGGSAGSATSNDGGADAQPQTVGATCDQAPCTTPPPPSAVAPNTTGTTTVIAISHLYLGDTDRQGNPSSTAWKDFGFNLDGLVSTKTDVNHCALVAGAYALKAKTDGDGGIDNSFGANVLGLLTSMDPFVSGHVNQSIADGLVTEIFRFDDFVDPASAPDQNGVRGAFYRGADKGSLALFDGTDVWPVTDDSVTGGDVAAPKLVFPSSYVAGGTWVSATKVDFVLPLMFSYFVRIPITGAVLTMRVKGTGAAASAVDGTIAGVVPTEALVAELRKVAGTFDPSLCSGSTFDSISQQIRSASDIMLDGTNGDPTKTCDGISIGIGFDGAPVQLGAVAAPEPPPPDPCAPAP